MKTLECIIFWFGFSVLLLALFFSICFLVRCLFFFICEKYANFVDKEIDIVRRESFEKEWNLLRSIEELKQKLEQYESKYKQLEDYAKKAVFFYCPNGIPLSSFQKGLDEVMKDLWALFRDGDTKENEKN